MVMNLDAEMGSFTEVVYSILTFDQVDSLDGIWFDTGEDCNR